MMQVSNEGRSFIEAFEGFVDHAYLCPAGVLTIGYGHTAGVKPGDTVSREAADALLSADLQTFGRVVEFDCQGTPTTQHEFDALESLAFNIGLAGFAGSTVLRMHKAGNKAAAAAAFSMWNKAIVGGELQPVAGLTRRRAAEAAVYLTPEEAAHPMPAPTPVAPQSMPQAVAAPAPVPAGYTVQPSGNVVRDNVKDSEIVKASDSGTKVGAIAAAAAPVVPIVGAVAGMDWKAMLGIAAIILAGGLAFAIYKLVQAKTARLEMSARGIA